MKLRITAGKVVLQAELRDTPTVQALAVKPGAKIRVEKV